MENCKEIPISIGSETYIDQDESSIQIDITNYLGNIGSLLYLMASRPDIMLSVCLCARFQTNPKESNIASVKRSMKYLQGTTN